MYDPIIEEGPALSEPPTEPRDYPDATPWPWEHRGEDDDHAVPSDLLELFEVLEYQAAVEEGKS